LQNNKPRTIFIAKLRNSSRKISKKEDLIFNIQRIINKVK